MRNFLKLSLLLTFLHGSTAYKSEIQPYDSWITGDPADVKTNHKGGTILMGGSTDVDEAHAWMLQNADGGDVVVIRASGKDGYNKYLFNLGKVNSVETLMVNSREIADLDEIAEKVRNAEALFIAGGDQGNYVRFWNNTKLSKALDYLINEKKVTVGGTSAGCAIMGKLYFGAMEGSVTSEEALSDPLHPAIIIGRNDFLDVRPLKNTITDTHYDARNRIGRHIVFMARTLNDWKVKARGIGVSEKTAVCVDPKGVSKIFGSGVAYFLSVNKGLSEPCQKNKPLNWPDGVKSTEIKGSKSGENTFDLKKWKPVSGTSASHIYAVESGVLKKI